MFKNVLNVTPPNFRGWARPHRNSLIISVGLLVITAGLVFVVARLLRPQPLDLYQQGQNLYQDGHYTEAVPVLAKSIATENNNSVAARLVLAETYLELAEPLEAEAQLRPILLQQPGNTEALYLSGQAFAAENQPLNADNAWNKVIQLNQAGLPLAQARLALGEYYLRTGRYQAASNLIYTAIVQGRGLLRPDNLQRAYYLYGLLLAHDLRYKDAAAELGQAVALKSQNSKWAANGRVQNSLATLADRAGSMLNPLNQAQQEKIEAAQRAKLGYAYLLANEYSLAEAQFQRVLQLVPAFADARSYLGLIYWQTGRTTLALDAFNQALKDDPTSRLGRQLLAEYLVSQVENYQPFSGVSANVIKAKGEQASGLLDQLSQQKPDDALVELDLAHLNVATRDYDKAVTHFERAITLTGGQPVQGINPGVELAQLYTNQGIDPCGRGLTVATQTVERTPQDPTAWEEAGLNFFMCHQAQSALEHFQHALTLRPNWTDALYQMAVVYQAQGNSSKASLLFDQVTDLDPSRPWPH